MNQVILGDALKCLGQLPDGLVQTCVTSPPYYGLRDYGASGQIGLEPTPDEFIARLVAVFHDVKRVLRDDGTLWVNIGDSYTTNQKGSGGATSKQSTNAGSFYNTTKTMPRTGYGAGVKEKDLIGIPWMLAFALRADGWYLRNEIIWAKPNPMPESILDRCTKSHEQIFLLSKSPQYYFDADAIKEPSVLGDGKPGEDRTARNSFKRGYSSRPANIVPGNDYNPHRPDRADDDWNIAYRNKRDVWTVSTKPYDGAHFATFPRNLIVPCILAGSALGDTVLDPFGGAGTTAKTAQELGRDYITIELNQKYVDEIILPRLAATSVPLPMPSAPVKVASESQAALL